MKTALDVYPNEPRRLIDEVIAHFIFGWRWLPHTTARPRSCWVFCAPNVIKVHDLPPGQICGPTTANECELQPALERIAYNSLPKFSLWLDPHHQLSGGDLAKAKNIPPGPVKTALRKTREYEKKCPASLRAQPWHSVYPALIVPVQKGFRVATLNRDSYETHAKMFPTVREAVKFNGTDVVDIYNRKLICISLDG